MRKQHAVGNVVTVAPCLLDGHQYSMWRSFDAGLSLRPFLKANDYQ